MKGTVLLLQIASLKRAANHLIGKLTAETSLFFLFLSYFYVLVFLPYAVAIFLI